MNHQISIAQRLCVAWLFVSLVGGCGSDDTQANYTDYTVNGESLDAGQAEMLAAAGLPPGGYWLDGAGNFGVDGAPEAFFQLDWADLENSGPWPTMRNGFGAMAAGEAEPGWNSSGQIQPAVKPDRASAPARQPSSVVDRVRLFWIQTSILSNSGASGYVHFCPGGAIYTSSEGSFSVAGGDGWAGGAHTSNASGRWSLATDDGQPYVNVEYGDGTSEWYWVSDLTSGQSWRSGQYKMAAERGRATCPSGG